MFGDQIGQPDKTERGFAYRAPESTAPGLVVQFGA